MATQMTCQASLAQFGVKKAASKPTYSVPGGPLGQGWSKPSTTFAVSRCQLILQNDTSFSAGAYAMLALFYKDRCKGKGNRLMKNLGLSGTVMLAS